MTLKEFQYQCRELGYDSRQQCPAFPPLMGLMIFLNLVSWIASSAAIAMLTGLVLPVVVFLYLGSGPPYRTKSKEASP